MGGQRMGQIIEQILGRLVSRLIGPVVLIGGGALVFALWCLDWAILESRRRPVYAVLLAVTGASIVGVVVLSSSAMELLKSCAFAALCYAVMCLARRRGRVRHEDPSVGDRE